MGILELVREKIGKLLSQEGANHGTKLGGGVLVP